jgi:DnaJ-class molecular chaperone
MISKVIRRVFAREEMSKELLDSLTHYELLKVKPDSSKADIRQSYLKLARKFHPDLQEKPSVRVI